MTLISLAELGVVLRGLYFFSTGGASDSVVLNERKAKVLASALNPLKHNPMQIHLNKLKKERPYERIRQSIYLGLLSKAGLMLYLSPSRGAMGVFFTGTGAGLSTSKPVETHK